MRPAQTGNIFRYFKIRYNNTSPARKIFQFRAGRVIILFPFLLMRHGKRRRGYAAKQTRLFRRGDQWSPVTSSAAPAFASSVASRHLPQRGKAKLLLFYRKVGIYPNILFFKAKCIILMHCKINNSAAGRSFFYIRGFYSDFCKCFFFFIKHALFYNKITF